MVSKGSIAVDGVSLTLVDVEAERFSVALIPHTLEVTTLGRLTVGDRVNLETDLLAKYAQKQAGQFADSAVSSISQSRIASRPFDTSTSHVRTCQPIRRSRTWRRRFSEAGIRLNTRHGQNFLIDLNLQRLIVERAELGPDDVVLEVGTGTGALTALMAPQVAAVVTVEIDPQLYQLGQRGVVRLSTTW